MRRIRGNEPVLVLAGLGVYLVKRHFSSASPEQLGWILSPTAGLAAFLTGVSFEQETGVGWVSRDLRFIIAPACAGVNFWIAAFCTLIWTTLQDDTTSRPHRLLARGVACAAGAYVAAIVANGVRIAITAQLHDHEDGSHRLLGLAVYLPLLFALQRLAERPDKRRTIAALFVPAICYLGITVLVPLANGAARLPRFGEHAVAVTASVATLVTTLACVRLLGGRYCSSAAISSSSPSVSSGEKCPMRPSTSVVSK